MRVNKIIHQYYSIYISFFQVVLKIFWNFSLRHRRGLKKASLQHNTKIQTTTSRAEAQNLGQASFLTIRVYKTRRFAASNPLFSRKTALTFSWETVSKGFLKKHKAHRTKTTLPTPFFKQNNLLWIFFKKTIDFLIFLWYNTQARFDQVSHGGLAQLARASGSYPAGRWFKSDIRYQECRGFMASTFFFKARWSSG